MSDRELKKCLDELECSTKQIEEYLMGQYKITEGLIRTSPIGLTIYGVGIYVDDNDKVYKKKGEDNVFYVDVKQVKDKKYTDKILTIANNYGWFPSHLKVTYTDTQYGKIERGDKFTQERYETSFTLPQLGLLIKFEAKYDIEIDSKFYPKKLYHCTFLRKWEKIYKFGLYPKGNEKRLAHPDRIYLAKTEDVAKLFAKNSKLQPKDKMWVLLEIDFANVSDHVHLYKDPNFKESGYYVVHNIPRMYISKLEEFEVTDSIGKTYI